MNPLYYRDWDVLERSHASCSARDVDTNKSTRWTPARFASVHETTRVRGTTRSPVSSPASHTSPRTSAPTTVTACPSRRPTPTDSSETKTELDINHKRLNHRVIYEHRIARLCTVLINDAKILYVYIGKKYNF